MIFIPGTVYYKMIYCMYKYKYSLI